MPSPAPIRQFSPVAALAHFALLFAILLAATRLLPDDRPLGLVLGVALFFGGSIALRRILTPEHERALRLLRRGRFAEAAAELERSYERLARRPWIDRWRWLVLLSPSRLGLRELALSNVALCRARLGDLVGARVAAERATAAFPGSPLARAALAVVERAETERRSEPAASS